MIAAATSIPAESTSDPVPRPGGDSAQATGPNGDDLPTFDHVLAREARSDDPAPSPRGSGDGTVAKGRDLREPSPHKDTDSAAVPPSDPALFFQLPLTPESCPVGGGSATLTKSSDSTEQNGSGASAVSIPATPVVEEGSGASITGTLERTARQGASGPQAPIAALAPWRTVQTVTPLPADQEGRSGDVTPSPTVGMDPPTDSRALRSAAQVLPARDPSGAETPDLPAPKTAPATSFSGIVVGPTHEEGQSPPARDAIRQTSNSALPTPNATPSMDDAAHRPIRQSAPPALDRNRELAATPVTHVLPATSASKPPIRPAVLSTADAPNLNLLDSRHVTEQSSVPTIQAENPGIEPNRNVAKPRPVTSSDADKEQEPAKPTAGQPAWLLNPTVTLGQSFTPSRNSRAATTQILAPLATTSFAADRVHHTDSTDAAQTGDMGTALNVSGLPMVHAGPSYARISSGQPGRTTGTDTGTALYQPIAQRVLVHGASLHVAGASSSFNVVLNPRSLGMVTVHVARGQEGLQVTITPQQNDTTALLNKHLPDLIGMLKQGSQDLPVQAQVVRTHGATTTHNGTPQAAGAGRSSLNTAANGGNQGFTGQHGNTEQGSWTATVNDLFGVPDRGVGDLGAASVAVQARFGGTARVDIKA